MALGADIGTYNLVVARRGEGDEVKYRKEVNAFIEMPLENRFLANAFLLINSLVSFVCRLPFLFSPILCLCEVANWRFPFI
jgi:hypothetical protein